MSKKSATYIPLEVLESDLETFLRGISDEIKDLGGQVEGIDGFTAEDIRTCHSVIGASYSAGLKRVSRANAAQLRATPPSQRGMRRASYLANRKRVITAMMTELRILPARLAEEGVAAGEIVTLTTDFLQQCEALADAPPSR